MYLNPINYIFIIWDQLSTYSILQCVRIYLYAYSVVLITKLGQFGPHQAATYRQDVCTIIYKMLYGKVCS